AAGRVAFGDGEAGAGGGGAGGQLPGGDHEGDGGCVDLTELGGEVHALQRRVVLLVHARRAVRGPLEELRAVLVLRLHVDLHEALGDGHLPAGTRDGGTARVELDDPHVRALDRGSARRVSCHGPVLLLGGHAQGDVCGQQAALVADHVGAFGQHVKGVGGPV